MMEIRQENEFESNRQDGELRAISNRMLYTPPSVVSYTDEDILDQLGPAQTGYGANTSGTLPTLK